MWWEMCRPTLIYCIPLLILTVMSFSVVLVFIASLFTKKSEIHNYNTRHCSSLHPAIGKSEATYRTFSYHAILIWNYLSKLICTNATLTCFKKRSLVYLQTHLIIIIIIIIRNLYSALFRICSNALLI